MAARNLRFTSGASVLTLADTDFWIEYTGEAQTGSAPVLGVVLHGVWEQANPALAVFERRTSIDDRLKNLIWDFVGKTGLLEWDYDTARVRSLSGITLRNVVPGNNQNNAAYSFDLVFEYPVSAAGGGVSIARSFNFGAKPLNAQNFILQYSKADPTVFKEVFRAAPVRIPAGPALKILRVTAIKQFSDGVTDLARRQFAENEIKDWSWNYQGNEAVVFIDGLDKGTFHLRDVKSNDLGLPDTFTFELELATGYAS